MGVNAYFGFRIKNIPHSTPNYGLGKSKFEIDYCRQTYCFPEKMPCIQRTFGKIRSRSNVFFKSIKTITCYRIRKE